MKKKYGVTFLLLVLLFAKAGAQNIINDTIKVSAGEAVTLKFPSDPEGSIPDGDGSYEIEGSKKSLRIKARKPDAKNQLLVVTEKPGRRHEFVLLYAEKAPKLLFDWSGKKELNTHVNEKKKALNNGLAAADADFEKADYDAALAKYSRLVYDAEETERGPIRQRMEECSQRGQAGKQKKFKEAMTRADAHAAAKRYREADTAYGEALTARPGDADAQAKRQGNSSAWCKDCAKRAAAAATEKNYALSKNLYEEAREANAKDFDRFYKTPYDAVLTNATEQAYKQQRKAGDDAFQVEDFDGAGKAYEAALSAKPEDKEVKAKLNKAKEGQEKAKNDKAKETEYYSILSTAKKLAAGATTAKQYDEAIDAYKRAEKLFADRRFPKERIEALMRAKNAVTAKR